MIKKIIIKKSEINKKGVFAARNFKKGEIVLKWHPKILKKSEINKLPKKEKHYVNRVGRKYLLMQPPERYVNHSCEPNTQIKGYCDIATKYINKGEEITSNYEEGGLISFRCKCGNKKCRGIIN